MPMNLPQFRNELGSLLQSTTNLTATVKTDLANDVIANNQGLWDEQIEKGLADTNANRAKFVGHMIIEYLRGQYNSAEKRIAQQSAPQPKSITDQGDIS